jgi:hypothetical protein
MSARWWLESMSEIRQVDDTWNFRHGDEVTFAGTDVDRGHIHRPRWWNVIAHVRWLIARRRNRAVILTMIGGGELRIIR